MKQIIQRHKNKIIFTSPILLLALLIFGALYFSSYKSPLPPKDIPDDNKSAALQNFKNLEIKAQAFVIYDATQKRIIYSRNELAQLPLASSTKIMSTLAALDIADKNLIIDVRSDSRFDRVNDKSSLLPGGWKLSDLLKLTLVSSSNSGINIISDQLPPLLEFMNQKATSLGLNQTYFLNESGLDIDENLSGAYGSALDMAILFDYAIKISPDVLGATKYNSITINSIEGYSETRSNTNPIVSQIEGLVASKTGLTDLAGGNLVIAFNVKEKNRIIIVVLGSTQDGRFRDTEILTKATLDYYK